jgi:hypothetical protein
MNLENAIEATNNVAKAIFDMQLFMIFNYMFHFLSLNLILTINSCLI